MFEVFKKDLKILLSDKKGLFLTFIMPIVLVSVFVIAFSGLRQDNKGVRLERVRLLVVDNDSTMASKYVIQHLNQKENLYLEPVDLSKAETSIQEGRSVAALIIYEGFNTAFSQGNSLPWEIIYQQGRDLEFGLLSSTLMPQLAELGMNANRMKETAGSVEEPLSQKENSKRQVPFREVAPSISRRNDPWLVQPIVGITLIFLLFNVVGLGSSIIEEKESGTLKRLGQSPISPMGLFWGKLFQFFLISIVQLTLVFTVSFLVFGLKIAHRLPELIAIITVVTFSLSSFGLLIVVLVKTRSQLQAFSMGVILVMSALGGSMIPLFIMPEIMQVIAKGSINYWALEAFYDLLWRDLPFSSILKKLLILTGIGLAITLLSRLLFRKKFLYSS